MKSYDFDFVKGATQRITVKTHGISFKEGDTFYFTMKREPDGSPNDQTAPIKVTREFTTETDTIAIDLSAQMTAIPAKATYLYDMWGRFEEHGQLLIAKGRIRVHPTITNRRLLNV